jgi:hypothetical protein
MEGEIIERDEARQSTSIERYTARHTLTIEQAAELFAELGVPRSKRSVQRFCEQGHLDYVPIKGVRGDRYFISRESVERYAEELRQVDAVASIGAKARQQRAIARYSAPNDDTPAAAPTPPPEPRAGRAAPDEARLTQLEGEVLNLRIDNRAKEQAINFLMAQASAKDQQLQDLSYRLGAAETRAAQLEAPKQDDDTARQSAPEVDTVPSGEIVEPTPASTTTEAPSAPPAPAPQRSFFGRLFG